MLRSLLFNLNVLMLACCLTSCTPPMRSFSGLYQYTQPNLEETIRIRGNGTFAQTLRMDGRVYSTEGKWSPTEDGGINFLDMYARIDADYPGHMVKPPGKTALILGRWKDRETLRMFHGGVFDDTYYLKRIAE